MVRKPPLTLEMFLHDLNTVEQEPPGDYVETGEVMLYVEGEGRNPEKEDARIVSMFTNLANYFYGICGTNG